MLGSRCMYFGLFDSEVDAATDHKSMLLSVEILPVCCHLNLYETSSNTICNFHFMVQEL